MSPAAVVIALANLINLAKSFIPSRPKTTRRDVDAQIVREVIADHERALAEKKAKP